MHFCNSKPQCVSPVARPAAAAGLPGDPGGGGLLEPVRVVAPALLRPGRLVPPEEGAVRGQRGSRGRVGVEVGLLHAALPLALRGRGAPRRPLVLR